MTAPPEAFLQLFYINSGLYLPVMKNIRKIQLDIRNNDAQDAGLVCII